MCQGIEHAEVGAAVGECAWLPAEVVLSGDGEFVAELGRRGQLGQRLEHFLRFHAWVGQRLPDIDWALGVRHPVNEREQRLAPVEGVLSELEVDRNDAEVETGEYEGVEELTGWSFVPPSREPGVSVVRVCRADIPQPRDQEVRVGRYFGIAPVRVVVPERRADAQSRPLPVDQVQLGE